ncbi:MAG: hypothetical protein K2Z80_04890 [Xanthobacteraceae bacterium]|nr:hypothetical protein [Xanthobacteraceae bacterium]
MIEETVTEAEIASADTNPRSSGSLIPMLVSGLVLTTIGMLVALALS